MSDHGPDRTAARSERTLIELLSHVADGDTGAFAEFYALTSSRVYGMVLRVLRDPGYSEETTQEVYLQVWDSAFRFDPRMGSPVSWLITMAHRRAIDRVRTEQSTARRESDYGTATKVTDSDVVSDEVTRRAESREVGDCLDTLSEIQHQSVTLAYYAGLTYREVADRLSVALPTVKSRIRDGLIKLKDCLGGRHDG